MGVRGNKGGCEAFGVAHESPGYTEGAGRGGIRGTESIGKQVIWNGLVLYLAALTALIYLNRNSGIIFASDTG